MEDRQNLEERAKGLDLKFPGNIGDKKLLERIEAREAEIAGSRNTQPEPGLNGAADDGQKPQAGATNAPAKDSPPLKSVPPEGDGMTVVVIGPQKGRRRIGRRFGQEPVKILADDLSQAEMDALMQDPTLAVSLI